MARGSAVRMLPSIRFDRTPNDPMSNTNPYAYTGEVPAAQAAVEERVAFLRKTYTLLLAGILTFAATLWAAGSVEPVRGMAESLARMVFGSRWGVLVYFGLYLGGSMAVHAFAEKKPINVVLFFGFAFLMGLLTAPLVYMVLAQADGVRTVNQAALLTAIIFTGLSAYVFFSGKSFSFLGGALSIGSWSLIGVALVGALMGFTIGLWFSIAVIALMAGYILYDTDAILRRYPTTMHVAAACVLFVDVIILFKHLLFLLARRD